MNVFDINAPNHQNDLRVERPGSKQAFTAVKLMHERNRMGQFRWRLVYVGTRTFATRYDSKTPLDRGGWVSESRAVEVANAINFQGRYDVVVYYRDTSRILESKVLREPCVAE